MTNNLSHFSANTPPVGFKVCSQIKSLLVGIAQAFTSIFHRSDSLSILSRQSDLRTYSAESSCETFSVGQSSPLAFPFKAKSQLAFSHQSVLGLVLVLLTLGVGQMWATTVNFSVGTYATAQSWSNGTAYSSATIDTYITATKNGTGDNGKYYTSNSSWRFYEANSGGITISTSSGTISSITFTYANGNNGVIKYNNTEKTSGTAISVSGSSVSFTVGHSSGTKNGNVQITAISVTYTPAASSYTLSSAVSPAASGSVNLSSTSLTQGSTATATATPAQHYVFSSWSISGTGASLSSTTTNPTTVTMGTANATVTANFTQAPKASITLSEAGATTTDATTYYVGDQYTLPSSTEATCSGKVLVGWSTVEVAETNTKPTSNYYEKGAKVTSVASQTFYAVFAKETGGGSTTQWIKTDLNEVTGGTYALLASSNKAFTGTISSGHGSLTTDAFSFTNNVATSAPTGTCEIEFQAVTGGFKLYNSSLGYLYIKAASSGNLAWHATEESYWQHNSDNWMYAGVSNARIRSASGTSLRSYGNNSGDAALALAKKTTVSTATYSKYSTTCCNELGQINGSVNASHFSTCSLLGGRRFSHSVGRTLRGRLI